MRFEYAGRMTLISAHSIIRWMERVEGRDLGTIRRMVESVLPIGKPGDKMIVQMIEKGLGVSLDPYREAIRQAVREGEAVEKGQGFDIMTGTGFVVCVRKDHGPGYNVATVLTEQMWTDERSRPWPGRTDDQVSPEDEADGGQGTDGAASGPSLRESRPTGTAEDPIEHDGPSTDRRDHHDAHGDAGTSTPEKESGPDDA